MTYETLLAGYGLIVMGGAIGCAAARVVLVKAVPQIRIVRGGRRADGKMIGKRMPLKAGYRTMRPILQFTGPDGTKIRFQDLTAQNCQQQPGDTVTVHYDPDDPKGSATILDLRGALRYFRTLTIGAVICFAFAVVGVLIVTGTITY
ncbi:MAG TPA: DUF3592 domain-containing protein [Pseudonocardiaceae bacterium]|jgi:hypothetical protein|nr:DUF3592 domain-containing protein [Pseudonocardiaceae bacterium]